MAGKLLKTAELPIREIDTSKRLRPVSETAVQSLMASIEEMGLQSEIHVRLIRHQGGRYRLMIGAHRIEAVRRLGCTSILAKVWDCTDDFALMAEIDDNLAHTDLAPLDLVVFLAERKTVYERMYPETKSGAFKGNQHTGNLVSDIMSFTTSVAEQRDMSKRQIERLVSAGQALRPEDIAVLRTAPARVTLSDLQTIAKCGDPKDRERICTTLAEGKAKSAKAALDQMRAKPGDVIERPADKQYRALFDSWSRASASVRKRFVETAFEDLSKYLPEEAEEPAEVVPFRARERGVS